MSDHIILEIISLVLILIGTILLASTSIYTKKAARELGVPRIAGNTDEENDKLPAVKYFRKQSLFSIPGLILLIIGIILQIFLLFFS